MGVWVDIDVEDFYEDLGTGDKYDLIDLLKQDGLLPSDPEDDDDDESNVTALDIEWAQMIQKINSSRYQLSAEQELILINLAKSL